MPVEIELKAWIDDYEQVKKRLFPVGRYVRSFEKTDTYWLPIHEDTPGLSIPHSGIRIRRERSVGDGDVEHKSVLVTQKKKKLSGKIEVNDEREFTVSDADLFEDLLCDLGLFKAMYKKKSGWEWQIPTSAGDRQPVNAEISLVKDLGWFLELELFAKDDSEQSVEESRKELFSLLARLRVPEEQIEVRSYSVLLQDRWKPK
ncbi:MAG: class IV adenylate cyclase [Treponema sp.]|nr:class IV adenylate cyclase [Treponema sp.]